MELALEIAMRLGFGVAVIGVASAIASAAAPAPFLDIRGAATRLTVIAEPRADVVVRIMRADSRLPLRVRRAGEGIYLSGDVGHHVRGCRLAGGHPGVSLWGRGVVPLEQLPWIVVRTPMAVRLSVGDAVFGEIGRAGSIDLTNRGCGDWTLADVATRLKVNETGAGSARTGSAGSADLSAGGTGGIVTGPVRAGLTAISSGSGAISVASVNGPLDARVAGSGDIAVVTGQVTVMTVSIAGSGAVRMGGVAQRLQASIAGSGDVSVAHVTGSVSKQVFGSGAVRVGRH